MNPAPPAAVQGPLALVCGGGSLPLAVADHVAARGRRVLLFPMQVIAAPADYERRDCTWVRIAQFGTLARRARAENCSDVVLIGSLVRPAFWQMRFDWTTIKMLPRLAAAFRGGDNHLLTGVAKLIEQEGFRVVGAHEVAPEILVREGALGAVQPTVRDHADVAFGLEYLRATGAFDVGQAVVVAERHILAVEAAEGTDGMLARVAELRASGRIRARAGTGVLVKAAKPAQDRRFDLPSIGPRTVEGVVRAGLAGLAVVAGETIVAEPEQTVVAADKAAIFVVGVRGSAP
jgi:DUF1009 family protein